MKRLFGFETNTEWQDVRMKVGFETTGAMPDGFEEAIADLYLPIRLVFNDLAKNAQYQAAVAEEEGYTCAIASQTFTTKGSRGSRRGSCTVVVMFFLPVDLDEERTENLESVLKVEIIEEKISPRLRSVFRQDSRDWRRANSFACRAKEPSCAETEQDEVDETTFEHIPVLTPQLRLVRKIA